MLGFPLRLSHAHAHLRPRKHLKRRRSAIARRTHPHAQFSASIVIFKSAKPYGLTLSGCTIRHQLSFLLIMLLALYQQIIFGQTIANLRSASAAPLITEVCISGTFSFGFRLSALRITHNPSELHGKRMAERLPARRSADSVSTGSARPSRLLCVGTLAHFRAGAMPFAHGGAIPLLEPDTRIELAHTAWMAVGLPLT